MITFFTTAKKFEGAAKDAQLNAIRSWLSIHENVEIFIFQKPEGAEFIPQDHRIKIIEDIELKFGIPCTDYMFTYTSDKACNSLCCFINADIVITKKFAETAEKVRECLTGKFLCVGQRYDFDNKQGEWLFPPDWEQLYLPGESMKVHPPTGSDYFLFPAGQYPKSSMVPLVVGRPGWDLWMIYDARKKKIPAIDLSKIYKVYHQNHDYSHKKVTYKNNLDEPEAKVNLSFLPADGKFDFTLDACDFFMDAGFKIRKSYSRGNLDKYLKIASILKKNILVSKLKFLLFARKGSPSWD